MSRNNVIDRARRLASPSKHWVMRRLYNVMRSSDVDSPEFRRAMNRLHKLADIIMKNAPEGIEPPAPPRPVIREGLRVRIVATGYVIQCLDERTAHNVEQFALAVHAAAFSGISVIKRDVPQVNTLSQAEQWYCTGQPYEWRNDPWEGNRS